MGCLKIGGCSFININFHRENDNHPLELGLPYFQTNQYLLGESPHCFAVTLHHDVAEIRCRKPGIPDDHARVDCASEGGHEVRIGRQTSGSTKNYTRRLYKLYIHI